MRSVFTHTLIRLGICLLIGVLASSAIGQTDQSKQIDSLEIKGPHEARPGELVRLSANTNANETPFWIVLDPIELDYEQVDQGRRLIFSASCEANQTITVMLLAQQMRDGKIVTRQLRRAVHVGNLPPSPAPVPIQQPPEPPLTPENDLKKSPLYDAVLQAWPLISTDAGKTGSPKVAENLVQIADQCANGKITEVSAIWQMLSQQNRIDLQLESVAWEPVGLAIQIQFKQLALNSIKAHAIHLRAASAAIEDAQSASQQDPNRKVIRR